MAPKKAGVAWLSALGYEGEPRPVAWAGGIYLALRKLRWSARISLELAGDLAEFFILPSSLFVLHLCSQSLDGRSNFKVLL